HGMGFCPSRPKNAKWRVNLVATVLRKQKKMDFCKARTDLIRRQAGHADKDYCPSLFFQSE
ncbi:MAG: hypothetical protein ACU83U_05965, partial [Gammaproteobacteria bacterium]